MDYSFSDVLSDLIHNKSWIMAWNRLYLCASTLTNIYDDFKVLSGYDMINFIELGKTEYRFDVK